MAPNTVLRVHPTQLYETALGFVMFLILWRLRDHKHAEGWLFGLYCVLAGLERFVIEFFRAKDDRFFGRPDRGAGDRARRRGGSALIIMQRRSAVGPSRPGIYATAEPRGAGALLHSRERYVSDSCVTSRSICAIRASIRSRRWSAVARSLLAARVRRAPSAASPSASARTSSSSAKANSSQQHQLRQTSLTARVQPERTPTCGKPGDHRDREHVPFLQLANALPHEDERHVVQQDARHREERTQRNAHAEAVEQREDHREHHATRRGCRA